MKRILFLIFALASFFFGLRTALDAQSAAPMVTRRNVELTGSVWPGDFNGDGITDLAGGSRVRLGNGDGSFKIPTDIGYAGAVLAVADFNRDGKIDVVAAQGPPSYEVAIVLGKGDGTFGTSWRVGDHADFVLSADFDGDGNRDVVLASREFGIRVFSNGGTGTFTRAATLPSGPFPVPNDGVIADVNGDGRRDILIADNSANTVSVYLNQGAFIFTGVDTAVGDQPNDVTVADLNGDGKLLLAVAVSRVDNGSMRDFSEGHVAVRFGNGDGTFDRRPRSVLASVTSFRTRFCH